MSVAVACKAAAGSRLSAFASRSSRWAIACRAASHKVTFRLPAGDEKTFQCTADRSLLEGALAAGIEPPHLCITGSCGVCAARVLAGNVERADFMLDDKQQECGFALLCTTFPRSDVTILTNQETELHTIPYGL
eukprot:GHUV01025455.1.p1 GENE.GHUV01025455.1~~GHUV01025455.1.p1  ORF type:complete len:134 (+),score=17.42 GHUV01025455.1:82-483(+)